MDCVESLHTLWKPDDTVDRLRMSCRARGQVQDQVLPIYNVSKMYVAVRMIYPIEFSRNNIFCSVDIAAVSRIYHEALAVFQIDSDIVENR